ncbi:hypothetical protein SEA_VINCENZO_59 [Mycobacterium phage Vincenzo]|uniref:Uncharacterized protein n=2 Tax=Coopervirus vincenzo TaxID=1983110 RepID=A0A0F6WDX3_9CAUD|nr:hypothetical protein SEA_VINCENZO_59 [Mycobacterium phage Vincenzo]AKF14321.1 hypothetical protein SEA_VINCENZO_59 [Mycobacterium phage Vincenzo]AKF14725.1 hypothetical protein SEA_ALANGRANT_60 [Mycobacterium phage AlanGrant]
MPTTDPLGPLQWLDSTNTVETRRYAEPQGLKGYTDTHIVRHRADFAVQALVPDMLAEFSRSVSFKPALVRAKWTNGVLMSVTLSGPRRLVSGEVSDNANSYRKREFNSYSTGVNRDALPAAVAKGLTDYETTVAGVAADGGDR